MPKLRESLKKPETYLVFFAILVVAVAGDAMRPAEQQLSARAYVGLIDVYQTHISPRMRSFVRCRYEPSCSEYSRQAVGRYGLLSGLKMSVRRTWSCRPEVPLGTRDPVP